MKKFFHPLLISLVIAIFPIISQAIDIPQGYILSILTIQMNQIDLNPSKHIDTTLGVNVYRSFEQSSSDIPNTISAEHYIFDTWTGVKSFEKTARFPEHANVFLSDHATVEDGVFYVCFEMKNIGVSCSDIPAKEGADSMQLNLSPGRSFATIRYKVTKAVISNMSLDEVFDPKTPMLVQLSHFDLDDQNEGKGFQISNSSEKHFIGDVDVLGTKTLTPEQPYVNDLSLMISQPGKHTLLKILKSDASKDKKWSDLSMSMDMAQEGGGIKMTLSRDNTRFDFRFYKITSPASHANWLDTGK